MSLAAYMRRNPTRRLRPAEAIAVPVPMGSVNTVSAGAAMPPEDCIYRKNLTPADFGNRVRLGSREWCTGLTGGGGEVRTLLPFTASVAASNKRFATTQTGIWDVTVSSAAPTQVVAFGIQDATAGHGVSHVMVTAAGHFLLYWDESNGYYVHPEGGPWAKIAQGAGGTEINGVNPANLVGGMVWKNRLWMIEKNTGKAWYLAVNAIYGTATSYNLGARFKAGGDLRQLASWTYDGGAGLDDSLVAVSGGGDVLIYQGTDPSAAATFGLKGVWSVGGVPLGRRICSEFGGDLLIQSTTGLLPISQLVLGKALPESTQYPTFKIANLWNRLQLASANLRGWSMAIHPLDATLLVTVPQGMGLASRVLAMSLAGKGWSEYTDLNLGIAMAAHENNLYFGTPDGKIKVMDGYVDGVTLADPNAYAAIPFSMLFQILGNARQKRISLIEPSFISEGGAPPFAVEARYRLDLADIASAPASAAAPGTSLWDTALWDAATWAAEYTASQEMRGAVGMGPEVAIAIRGTAASRTILTGFRVVLDQGGIL